MKDAQECQGPGVRVRMQQLAPGFVQQVQQRDERCISQGKMWRPDCRECPNKTETEKINLTIELTPGMRPGERVTFEGVTDEKPGFTAGDLHFVIVEQAHNVFHRDRDDLYKTMEIPLVDALVSPRNKSCVNDNYLYCF
jgi:DnaJ-class molecular chaperone